MKRARDRVAAVVVSVVLGLAGTAWFYVDWFVRDEPRFAALALLLAGAGWMAAAVLVLREKAKVLGRAVGALIGAVAALLSAGARRRSGGLRR